MVNSLNSTSMGSNSADFTMFTCVSWNAEMYSFKRDCIEMQILKNTISPGTTKYHAINALFFFYSNTSHFSQNK